MSQPFRPLFGFNLFTQAFPAGMIRAFAPLEIVNYLFPAVTPFQSSVLKGTAGSPSRLYRLQPSGLLAHAYRTETGSFIVGAETMIELPSIIASAQTNFLSFPAIAKCFNLPSLAMSPEPVLSKMVN